MAFLYTHAKATASLPRATLSRPNRTACSLRRTREEGDRSALVVESNDARFTRRGAHQPETARVHGEDDLAPAPVARGDLAPLRERERVERRAQGVEALHVLPREGARCGRE